MSRRLLMINGIGLVFVVFLTTIAMVSNYYINSSVQKLTDTVLVKKRSLKQLLSATGYDGSIHHMKNYVLRHDSRYITRYEQSRSAADQAIAKYRTAGELSDVESESLDQIESMLDSYDQAMVTAKAMPKGAETIDGIVRIDDTMYIAAVHRLSDWLHSEVKATSALK